ncbi:hypothetical protein ALC56_11601 [Trachymyrmex septentrionalis]|uniref:Uncharacterized protein n=1 Tax=Trachymyrmex septentrionalis TaxID=34720 RepID=A0A195F139_9HYME|nr:hypothetical protein ALC56_11601 [Trachymyrmex septentrionalis]
MNSIVRIATRGPRGRRPCIEDSTLEPQDSRSAPAIKMRLSSARDSHAYVPHLIAAGLGCTGFEERRDNEIRSNSSDRLLHRSLSLGQCRGERPVATGTEGRPKGQGRRPRLTVLLERVSSGYDLRELKSSSRNPRFTLAGSHAAGNCVVK